jgi:hypothetical protein
MLYNSHFIYQKQSGFEFELLFDVYVLLTEDHQVSIRTQMEDIPILFTLIFGAQLISTLSRASTDH